MGKQIINTGHADKGDGDKLRNAFTKVNANFDELYEAGSNTDNQTLTLTGTILTITGGNSVTLPSSVPTENLEIDGGNANTPSLGELIIDGNGA